MARMHARRRGKSGSNHPVRDGPPEWIGMLPREVESKVAELGRLGIQPAVIGLTLRDSHGVPNVKELTGKSVTQILAANEIGGASPVDLQNLVRRAVNLNEHMTSNRKDLHNLRGLELIEARIRRLARYYKSKGMLAEDWKYVRKTARLLVE